MPKKSKYNFFHPILCCYSLQDNLFLKENCTFIYFKGTVTNKNKQKVNTSENKTKIEKGSKKTYRKTNTNSPQKVNYKNKKIFFFF